MASLSSLFKTIITLTERRATALGKSIYFFKAAVDAQEHHKFLKISNNRGYSQDA